MIKIRVPASTSNMGPGFDCLGMALDMYSVFEAQLSDRDVLLNTEPRFSGPDNLFLKAYHACGEEHGVSDHVAVTFRTGIPVSRGLGSSASLICAAAGAWHLLHGEPLSKEEAVAFASRMEGHPDNAAPCICGGLCASLNEGTILTRRLKLDPDWIFTVIIPDFEVSTEAARSILPDSYSAADTIHSVSSAVLLCEALASGDQELLNLCSDDRIHEPWRRTLIRDFDIVKKTACDDTGGTFFISGSGSACILISRTPLSEQAEAGILRTRENWRIRQCRPAFGGLEKEENGIWHPIF